MAEKRYFAVIMPRSSLEAILIAGYERGGKVIHSGRRCGFALDYYPDEAVSYRREFGRAIIGDFATRGEAVAAIMRKIRG